MESLKSLEYTLDSIVRTPILLILMVIIPVICQTQIGIISCKETNSTSYDIGQPILTDIWIDPIAGSDDNDGSSKEQPLRSISKAWSIIPKGSELIKTGYRIMLMPGDYYSKDIPSFWDSVLGRQENPIVIQAAGGSGSSRLHGYIDLQNSRYVYFIDLDIITDKGQGGGGNVLHVANCDHILVRGCHLNGSDGFENQAQETLKANQVQYIYVENCDISGAFWFPLDFVAVQHAHLLHNKIHNAGDWGIVLKGGSAYILVDGNEIFDCITGGFTAGQGTGFNWMRSPWLHYEASDIKFINNLVHNTEIAGLGVSGGYNILIAYNTLYNAGQGDHALEVVHGFRGCDDEPKVCQANNVAGGWGTAREHEQYIPNRNIYIFNNIIYNKNRSLYQQFVIRGETKPPEHSNVPDPSRADDNLRIQGNLIWNGPPDYPDLPLLGDAGGCQNQNPTCNERQLRSENFINILEPQLRDPELGNFRPITGSNVYESKVYDIPNFPGGDRPKPPIAMEGELNNIVLDDFEGKIRVAPHPPGAYS